MINNYFVDEITLINDSYDEWGVISSVETTGIKARVEDDNSIIKNINGKEIQAEMIILCGKDNNITDHTKIKIIKKGGIAYTQADKKWDIKRLGLQVGFSSSHWELYL